MSPFDSIELCFVNGATAAAFSRAWVLDSRRGATALGSVTGPRSVMKFHLHVAECQRQEYLVSDVAVVSKLKRAKHRRRRGPTTY